MEMKSGLQVASRSRQVNLRPPAPYSLLLAANFHPYRRAAARVACSERRCAPRPGRQAKNVMICPLSPRFYAKYDV